MDELKEAVKEALRVVVLAIIPVIIDSLSKGEVDVKLVVTVGVVALLRFIDSWLHETGKAKLGLTRF